MPASFRFVPDRPGIDDLTHGPAVAPILTKAARAAVAPIRANGPRRMRSFFGYRRSISAIPATGNRPVAYVGSDSPGWHLVEYGTDTSQPFAAIRRGIRQTGIRLEEGTG